MCFTCCHNSQSHHQRGQESLGQPAQRDAEGVALLGIIKDLASKEDDTDAVAMAIMKNIPSRCGKQEVLEVISKLGFSHDVAHFRMPQRVGKCNRVLNRGYAFVCFRSAAACERFVEAASGYRGFAGHQSDRAISAQVAPLTTGATAAAVGGAPPARQGTRSC